MGQAGLAVPVEPAGAGGRGYARTHCPGRGGRARICMTSVIASAGSGCTKASWPASRCKRATWPAWQTRLCASAGALFPRSGLSLCHARPGRISLGQFEHARESGASTPFCEPQAMNTDDRSRKGAAALTPLPADRALENYFLEARSKLLDVAAILDRINRGLPNSELDQRSSFGPDPPGHGSAAGPERAAEPSASRRFSPWITTRPGKSPGRAEGRQLPPYRWRADGFKMMGSNGVCQNEPLRSARTVEPID